MRKSMLAAAALLTSFMSLSAAAEPLAQVSLLQPPVWIERGGHKAALGAGAELQAGDRLVTGARGRVHLALGDASTVKLGENAEFLMPELGLTQDNGDSMFKGVLQVVKGAFRYTTSALGKLKRRDISVRIGPTVTAGIRGTDIWGKSDTSQDLICLLEGSIEVASPGQPAQRMSEARTFYVVPQGKSPLPITGAPEEKLATWAPQTELREDAVALQADGKWSVLLAQYTDSKRAQQRVAELGALGYAVEAAPRTVHTIAMHGLVMKGFASQEDALVFASRLQAETKFIRNPQVLPPA